MREAPPGKGKKKEKADAASTRQDLVRADIKVSAQIRGFAGLGPGLYSSTRCCQEAETAYYTNMKQSYAAMQTWFYRTPSTALSGAAPAPKPVGQEGSQESSKVAG
jgi:hypothetical protein